MEINTLSKENTNRNERAEKSWQPYMGKSQYADDLPVSRARRRFLYLHIFYVCKW